MRSALLASCVAWLSACGASEHPVAPPVHAEEAVRAPEPEPLPDAGVSTVEPTPEPDAGSVDAGPIDHRARPCFADRPATAFAQAPWRHPDGRFEVTVRTSTRADAHGRAHVRPGTTVRFDVGIENVGETDVRLSASDVSALATLHVMGPSASWTEPLEGVEPLVEGQHLAPHAILRLCAAFEVPGAPIDAAPPGERTRVYALDGPGFSQAQGGYLQVGRQTIVVRYPRERGAVVREAESWGGVVRVVLRPGVRAIDVARALGLRLGSGVPLFAGQRGGPRVPQDAAELVQVPETMRVADAVAALAQHPDVTHATPVMRGDPGTEGCSAYSPCATGEVCCYLCGIPGCPNGCYQGRSCPMGIP